MSCAYVALGSNLEQPGRQVTTALAELDELPSCSVTAASPLYVSSAVGPGEQPDYINAVAQLNTNLQPLSLLDALQALENRHQRVREQRWGPRTLDLDLLLFDDITLDTPRLTLPHPRLTQRNFVLYPLHDISPALTLPCGTPIASLLASCPQGGLHTLAGDPGAA